MSESWETPTCYVCGIEMTLLFERPKLVAFACPDGCSMVKAIKDKEFQYNCIHKGYCLLDCFGCIGYVSDLDIADSEQQVEPANSNNGKTGDERISRNDTRWKDKKDGWHPANDNDEEMGFALVINGKWKAMLEGTQIEDSEHKGEYKLWFADETDGEYFDTAKDRTEAWRKLQDEIDNWPMDGYEHLTIPIPSHPVTAKER